MPSVGIEITVALTCLLSLAALPSIAGIAPNLFGCIAWWKENIHLNSSGHLKRARNRAGILLMPAFLLICSNYGVYPPTETMDITSAILYNVHIFGVYLIIRFLCVSIFRNRDNIGANEYGCAVAAPFNYFIIACIFMALTSLVAEIAHIGTDWVRPLLRCELIVVYALCLLRKTQIFAYNRGFFSGILYLCTLEILPTGLLIAPIWLLQYVH